MSAAVASTVEATAPVESATTTEARSTVKVAAAVCEAIVTAEAGASVEITSSGVARPAAIEAAASMVAITAMPVAMPVPVVPATVIPIAAMPAVSVIPVPRTGADEHAACKPVRTVVAVRRTGVRVIRIVAIGADRRTHHDGCRPNSHAYHNSLRVRGRRRHQESCEYRENS